MGDYIKDLCDYHGYPYTKEYSDDEEPLFDELIYLFSKAKKRNIYHLTYEDMAYLGISRSTLSKKIPHLVSKGLLLRFKNINNIVEFVLPTDLDKYINRDKIEGYKHTIFIDRLQLTVKPFDVFNIFKTYSEFIKSSNPIVITGGLYKLVCYSNKTMIIHIDFGSKSMIGNKTNFDNMFNQICTLLTCMREKPMIDIPLPTSFITTHIYAHKKVLNNNVLQKLKISKTNLSLTLPNIMNYLSAQEF